MWMLRAPGRLLQAILDRLADGSLATAVTASSGDGGQDPPSPPVIESGGLGGGGGAPVAPGAEPAAIREPPPELPARPRLDILLVESNEFNQAVATHTLRRRGHRVAVARDGAQALQMTSEHVYDIVLLDVQMPEADGLEAARTIRERERSTGEHLPILAMTAPATEGDAAACLEAGVDGYLSKPLRVSSMWTEIERVRATARRGSASTPAAEPPLDSGGSGEGGAPGVR